jgi:hypothetical protein
MRQVVVTLVLGLALVLLAALVVLVAALAFTGLGAVINRLVGLGLFESTVIATLAGFTVIYVTGRIFSSIPSTPSEGDEEEEWEEEEWEEEEEPEPPIVSWRRGKLESTARPEPPPPPPPRPSRRKRKR